MFYQLCHFKIYLSLGINLTKQYCCSSTDIPAMNQLSDWLKFKKLPDNDNEENLIHGDFRLDNMVFHPKEVLEPCLQN